MTITYPYGNSLYVNVTNRCPNRCRFCVRTQADGFYSEDLWLKREPTKEEILSDLLSNDLTAYDAVVFCGYGEPTERLDDILFVAKALKKLHPALPLRLNTNGQADLIRGKSTAPLFADSFDTVSISLNAPTPEGYQAICRSRYGEKALPAILSFASEIKDYVPKVVFSVVRGTIPDGDIDRCQAIADACGIPLRIREYIQNETKGSSSEG